MTDSNRNSTFRFPFDINPKLFLGLAIFFFIVTIKPINEIIFPRVTPINLKAKIEKDIVYKIKLFKEVYTDTNLIHAMLNRQLSPLQVKRLQTLPFTFYLYNKKELVFWNNNTDVYPKVIYPSDKLIFYEDNYGYYVLYRHKLNSVVSAMAFIKIKSIDIGISDETKKHFIVGDKENDFGIGIKRVKTKHTVPVNFRGAPVFYLEKKDDFFQINDTNGWRLFLNALPFIFFGISIHTFFKVIIKKNNAIRLYLIMATTVLLIRFLTYYFGFPTNYDEYTMFSPEVYALNHIHKSLGDLFVNMCLIFWLLLFYSINVQGEYNERKWLNNAVAGVILITLVYWMNSELASLISSLVNYSVINFDSTLISQIDVFSIVGLLTVLVILANMFIINFIAYNYLKHCFKQVYTLYAIHIALGIVYLLYVFFNISYKDCLSIAIYVIFSNLVYYILHEQKIFKIKLDFNSYSLLMWMMIVSFLGTIFISNEIVNKEKEERKNFAQKLLQVEDKGLEEDLKMFRNVIKKDSDIYVHFKKHAMVMGQDIVQMLYDDFNLGAHFDRYKKEVHFIVSQPYRDTRTGSFDDELSRLKMEVPILLSNHEDSIVKQFQNFNEKGYVTSFEIKDSNNLYGIVVIKLSSRNNIIEKDYADFLFQNTHKNLVKEYNYSIAMYEDSIINYRIGSVEFPYKLSKNDLKKLAIADNFYVNKRSQSQLWYKNLLNNKIIIISKESNFLYIIFTLFAYMFFIYFVAVSIYILGNVIARSNLQYDRFVTLLSLNLRLRIQSSILLVVLLSFSAVGYFTYDYLIKRVKNKSTAEISTYGMSLMNKINNYYQQYARLHRDSVLDIKQDISFSNFLKEEAKINAKGINIFSLQNGGLTFTSQPDFYYSKITSDKLPYDVYNHLINLNTDHYFSREKINDLTYIAMYSFIKNAKGQKIGILQLPYFSADQEAKGETSTILITLINIYVFVFLISSIIALFLSNSVTKPFKYIVKQFTKINLSKTNEPLKWNNSDEIGLLVKEYNRMLRKLENSTVLLAKSERELAWREMAKQVAHEIKNPLTPMKLSLQMLERAIKTNKPNVTEMTERVTATLIEQIDNLSYIATNFSNFAKMPELNKELVVLNDVLYAVTGMYNDSKTHEFLFLIPDFKIMIYADKSQLIRVFTNIIQNAIQSIPEDRKGNITLDVSKMPKNFIRVSISDNGEGISQEKSSKLFQPYFTTKTSGTGLGLAMSKDIIDEFGGIISYDSIINQGTVFHIDLPIHSEHD